MGIGVVKNIEIDEEGLVLAVLRPSSSVCPAAFALASEIKRTLLGVSGVSGARIRVENYARAAELGGAVNQGEDT